jgi:Right handed beta helix region
MQRPFRTVTALFTVCGLLLSLALGPSITRPAAAAPLAVATITVDTGNDSNTVDDELSLHEALDAVAGDKLCFTDHEASLISGVTLNPDIFLTCGEAFGVSRWISAGSFFPAVIQFKSYVSDVILIGALPPIVKMTTIDGWTINGKVRLKRLGGWVGSGLTISGCFDCTHDVYIHNLKIEGFSKDGITDAGVGLTSSNFQGLEIDGNDGNGIYLSHGDKNPHTIIIGGPTLYERNVIYHNGGVGIIITGTAASDWTGFDMLIQGNLIGMEADGTPHGNGSGGILLNNTRGVTVGGATSADANTVVHNYGDGVKIAGASADNVVSNNFIGADSGGLSDRGNTGTGVTLLGGANNNTVSFNLISGNNGVAGVYISGSGTSANSILQNRIGLGLNSTLGNLGDGVLLDGLASSNVLSGTEIGWNGQNGVHITGGATLNQLFNNYIGVNGSFNIGNVLDGVLIDGGANNNLVGAAGLGNFIGGNVNDGVNIQGPGTANNSVFANLIGLSDTGLLRSNNSGVAILNGASNNTIGAARRGNTIVGNRSAGVFIADAGTTNNFVYANYIGTNAAGSSGLGNSGAGVYIAASANNNTVGGTILGNVISGNAGPGVDISTNGNAVSGNKIGTNAAGTLAVGNLTGGVRLSGGAQGNFIGYLNVISGNAGDGIKIDTNSDNNYVLGNTVGLNAARTAQIPNTGSGVAILNFSSGNLVGIGGAANVIAGNGAAGVFIADPGTDNNTVYANYIGTNELSEFGLGNSGDGLIVANGASKTAIGDDLDAGNRNTISGNDGNGVLIAGSTTNNVTVTGNYIGTNVAGTRTLYNVLAGIAVVSSANVTIGGDSGTVVQCISGNGRQGIYAQGTQFLKIKGSQGRQYIGMQCNSDATDFGNGMQGVLLDNTQHTVVTPYLISDNGGAGIAVTGASALANMLRPVIDVDNGGLAIDLGDDGVTPNDPGDVDTGPNGLLNYPEVKNISGSTISGIACPNCTIFTYRALGNPTGPGGGAESTTQVAHTNASGAWSLTLTGGLTPYNVTLQACEAANCSNTSDANTSELSPLNPFKVYLPMIKR